MQPARVRGGTGVTMGSRRQNRTPEDNDSGEDTSSSYKVSSNRDIDTTRNQHTEQPPQPAMPSEDTKPSATGERSRNRSGTDNDRRIRRVSSPAFARTDLPNGDVDHVFTTEVLDGDESPAADTDTSDSSTESSDPSSRADQSSLDRDIAAAEDDDDYDTDLESDEEPERRRHKPLDYDPIGTDTYLEECTRLGITPITYFLRTIQDKALTMKHHGLGELDMKALAKPLPNNTKIEMIDLEGNDIGPRGAKYLCQALRDNVYVTELLLADNNIGSSGAEILCKMLGQNCAISTLDLSSNNFRDGDGKHFYELLYNNGHLKNVSLRHNHFEDQAAMFLRDAVVNNSHLQVLDLSWNQFRMKGAEFITEIILENDSLKYLDLSMNGLSNDGARLVSEALATNENLLELNISGNRISIEGASHIARALERNTTLLTLRMGNNPLGKEGAGAYLLLEALQKNLENSALNLLDVMNVVVTKEFEALHKDVNTARTKYLQVIHGGVLFHNKHTIIFEELDPYKEFERDPMTKLKKYADSIKYRLIDVFKQFDRNNDWKLTRAEFLRGVQAARLDISPDEVGELMWRLDKNGDGEIDYEELMYADDENRRTKRQIDAYVLEREALLRPAEKAEVTLNLGTVETIEDQLAHQETAVHNHS